MSVVPWRCFRGVLRRSPRWPDKVPAARKPLRKRAQITWHYSGAHRAPLQSRVLAVGAVCDRPRFPRSLTDSDHGPRSVRPVEKLTSDNFMAVRIVNGTFCGGVTSPVASSFAGV